MDVTTDVGSATELMRDVVGEARAEWEAVAEEAKAALREGPGAKADRARDAVVEAREALEALEDSLKEVVSFANDHLCTVGGLISETEEQESALEDAELEEEDDDGED